MADSQVSPETAVDGEWYWVRLVSSTGLYDYWQPAMRTERGAAGGWTNCDTWEDHRGEVKEFRHIQPPSPEPGFMKFHGPCLRFELGL